jgi:hypothetical protein
VSNNERLGLDGRGVFNMSLLGGEKMTVWFGSLLVPTAFLLGSSAVMAEVSGIDVPAPAAETAAVVGEETADDAAKTDETKAELNVSLREDGILIGNVYAMNPQTGQSLPVSQARVEFYQDGSLVGSAEVNPDGSFEVPGLEEGAPEGTPGELDLPVPFDVGPGGGEMGPPPGGSAPGFSGGGGGYSGGGGGGLFGGGFGDLLLLGGLGAGIAAAADDNGDDDDVEIPQIPVPTPVVP